MLNALYEPCILIHPSKESSMNQPSWLANKETRTTGNVPSFVPVGTSHAAGAHASYVERWRKNGLSQFRKYLNRIFQVAWQRIPRYARRIPVKKSITAASRDKMLMYPPHGHIEKWNGGTDFSILWTGTVIVASVAMDVFAFCKQISTFLLERSS